MKFPTKKKKKKEKETKKDESEWHRRRKRGGELSLRFLRRTLLIFPSLKQNTNLTTRL
jgi:hypothetical protein